MSETYDLAEMWLREATGAHTAREIEPGIYEHTFTPPYWTSTQATDTIMHPEDAVSEMAELAGTLSLDALSRVLDDMYANARDYSLSWLLTSTGTARRIRRLYHECQMYRAHPIPRRKIRKCHMRKVHQHWRKGRAHIRRVELAERVREEAAMQRLRGNPT